MSKEVADALESTVMCVEDIFADAVYTTRITNDGAAMTVNAVDGLFAIADAVGALARAVDRLGNGNAATQMGAIENLAKEVRDAGTSIAEAGFMISSTIDRCVE